MVDLPNYGVVAICYSPNDFDDLTDEKLDVDTDFAGNDNELKEHMINNMMDRMGRNWIKTRNCKRWVSNDLYDVLKTLSIKIGVDKRFVGFIDIDNDDEFYSDLVFIIKLTLADCQLVKINCPMEQFVRFNDEYEYKYV